MRRAVKLSGVLVAAVLVWTALGQTRAAVAASIPKDALYVPGEVIVVLRGQGRTASSVMHARSLARKVGGRVAQVSGRSRAAVIKAGAGTDVYALSRRLAADYRVRFAEPNYVYRASGFAAGTSSVATPPAYFLRRIEGSGKKQIVSTAALRAMKTRTSAGIRATYPSDKFLMYLGGWDWVNASIVWNNTAASKNVCVIDTGVDYLHTDLTTARVIKGMDRVNEDSDPMDDNGHGTHVAGIIAAKQNNTEGIAGVSPTAKVVAVKALNADGFGTSFDIAQAITDCANRTDVSIINMSFGGPYSELQRAAIEFATLASPSGSTKQGKLIVASAGNGKNGDLKGSDMPYCDETTTSSNNLKAGVREYPAGFATESKKYRYDHWDDVENKAVCVPDTATLHGPIPAVLSVAASGSDDSYPDYSCRAEYSNFGDWVNMTAPGTGIYSTTPWDKPFTMNVVDGLYPRYDYLSGTSMAAAFVSGVAARAFGYLYPGTPPPGANTVTADHVMGSGNTIDANDVCWPETMALASDANVASALARGRLYASAIDAVTGLPLMGATIQAGEQKGTTFTVKSSAVVSSIKSTVICDPLYPDTPECMSSSGTSTYLYFPDIVELINLPANMETTLKVSKSGYTVSATNAFVGDDPDFDDGRVIVPWGGSLFAGYAAVPPKSARFTAVSAWDWSDLWDTGEESLVVPRLTTALPDFTSTVSKPASDNLLPAQAHNFVVGWDVCKNSPDDSILEGDPTGELTEFPFAQAVYQNWVDTHQIGQRSLSGKTPSLPALPRYTGFYTFRVWDPTMGFQNRKGSLFVWKDGKMAHRQDLTDAANCDDTTTDWWEAAQMVSGQTGGVSFIPKNKCVTKADFESYPSTCQ